MPKTFYWHSLCRIDPFPEDAELNLESAVVEFLLFLRESWEHIQ